MHITCIQPRYSWGKHVYLPNGLLSVAARVMGAGETACIVDENMNSLNEMHFELARADTIGIGILGAPYAPEALRVAQELRRMGHTQPIVFGGEFVNRLTTEERTMIFGRIGNVSTQMPITLPTAEETSTTPALEALTESMQRAYFSREWCFFTSRGCVFDCNFCAAEKGVRERFRNREAWEDETACLARLTKRYAGATPNYSVYLSSLDTCQNPSEMERILETVAHAFTREGVALAMRSLATAKCTAKAVRDDADVLRRWQSYGLRCLAIGVDGSDPVVWKRENKRHNTPSEIREALDAIQAADMLAETLMIIGFPSDSPRAIVRGAAACLRFMWEGMRARPYLGKAHAPGTKGWKEDRSVTEYMLTHPDALRELDYGSCGSPLTHKNCRQRWMANTAYLATIAVLKMASPHGCPTQPLLPTETIAHPLRPFTRIWNRLLPADK